MKKSPCSSVDSNDPNHIYYNVVIPYVDNSRYNPTLATFMENRTIPILEKCDDYYLSIIRFYVPSSNIPLTILDILPFPNVNPNLTTLSVILSYNAINSDETSVVYTSQNQFEIAPPAATLQNPNYPTVPYYYIYNYQHVIDMVNTAFQSALINLKAKPGTGAIAGAPEPYFTYNPETQLLTLNADDTFYDVDLSPNVIKIYVNFPFLSFFGAIPTLLTNLNLFAVNSYTFQYLIKNNGNNDTAGIINYEQEYVTIGLWNVFKSLVFISGTVPISTELIPATNGSGNTIGRRILTDFDPLINDQAGQANGILQYYPQGPYRLVNMVSSIPLTKFDVSIFWQDKNQNLYPLYVLYNNVITIKFLFVKKSVYNGITK